MSKEEKYLEHNYETSQDYELLYELMQTQRIICLVEPIHYEGCVDVADTSPEFNKDFISIGARGVSYLTAHNYNGENVKDKFIEQCKKLNLKFLPPMKKED